MKHFYEGRIIGWTSLKGRTRRLAYKSFALLQILKCHPFSQFEAKLRGLSLLQTMWGGHTSDKYLMSLAEALNRKRKWITSALFVNLTVIVLLY